ncbi:MAG: N-acetyltransferase [Promethearchaeota archaeon]|nr:MAG: N-acetyltransferase [Candidatus Lokiarchaeota archaeon]
MNEGQKKINFQIKIAENESFLDLKLCAKEFIEFVDDFKKKFQNKKFFILTAYDNCTLIGILIAEDKSNDIDSLDKIIPKMRLYLVYVNPKFRHLHVGKRLINTFLMIKKKEGYAGIIVKLPQNYRKGINYFLKNSFLNHRFYLKGIKDSKMEMEMDLWNNLGIREYIAIDNFTYDI